MPHTAKDLAETMLRVLAQPEAADALAQAGMRDVKRTFNDQIMNRQHAEVIAML
jgi:hypothetical protein